MKYRLKIKTDNYGSISYHPQRLTFFGWMTLGSDGGWWTPHMTGLRQGSEALALYRIEADKTERARRVKIKYRSLT